MFTLSGQVYFDRLALKYMCIAESLIMTLFHTSFCSALKSIIPSSYSFMILAKSGYCVSMVRALNSTTRFFEILSTIVVKVLGLDKGNPRSSWFALTRRITESIDIFSPANENNSFARVAAVNELSHVASLVVFVVSRALVHAATPSFDCTNLYSFFNALTYESYFFWKRYC